MSAQRTPSADKRTSAAGGTGNSLTFRDPGSGRWRQIWVDASGRLAEYEGDFDAQGRLVMEDRTVDATGTESRSRGTWTANEGGTVRQVFEAPAAEGGWQVVFDGLYTRAPEAP